MKALLVALAMVLAATPAVAHPDVSRKPANPPAPRAPAAEAEASAVRAVLAEYKSAIERLDATSTSAAIRR